MSDGDGQYWIRKLFKGRPVHVRSNPGGEVVESSGLVDIRYSTGKTRLYRGSVRNLTELASPEEALLLTEPAVASDEASPSASPTSTRKTKKSRSGKPVETPPEPRKGAIVAWTDGACSGNPGPAGLGVVLIEAHQRTEISGWLGDGTNNIAELRAIEEALLHIPDPANPVDLYTDSSYSIGVLTKGWKAKANVDLIARIRGVVRRFSSLQMHWVRGHVGTEENECADALARAAVETRQSSEVSTATKEMS